MKKTEKQSPLRPVDAPCADTGAVKYLDQFGAEYEGWSTSTGLPMDTECADVPGGEDAYRARSVRRLDRTAYADPEKTEATETEELGEWKGQVNGS